MDCSPGERLYNKSPDLGRSGKGFLGVACLDVVCVDIESLAVISYSHPGGQLIQKDRFQVVILHGMLMRRPQIRNATMHLRASVRNKQVTMKVSQR